MLVTAIASSPGLNKSTENHRLACEHKLSETETHMWMARYAARRETYA